MGERAMFPRAGDVGRPAESTRRGGRAGDADPAERGGDAARGRSDGDGTGDGAALGILCMWGALPKPPVGRREPGALLTPPAMPARRHGGDGER
mmetsp:Transcript_4738/g.15319  ORF Transcript_4738/g.15319 Transcript_4738/m.15319 type:complete len:94 (+) Transcript_4738:611-892(+)